MQERDKKFGSTYFDLIENEVLENERKINELVDSHTQLRDDLVILIEKKHVWAKASELIRDNKSFVPLAFYGVSVITKNLTVSIWR